MKTAIKVAVFGVILILVIIAIVLVLRYQSRSKFFKGVLLKGEIVIPSDSLGHVVDILCLGDYLVFHDSKPLGKRGKIQIYSLNDFSFITSTGRAGSGPGELRSSSHLNYVPGNSYKFSIFDVSLKRLTVYILNDGVCLVDKIITIEGGGVDQAHIVNDTTIATFDILSEGRVTLHNFAGKKIGAFGELLPGAKKGVPLDIHKAAMQGKLKVSPDGNYYVVISSFSDFIDVYDKNKNLVRFHGPYGFLPKYNVASFQGYPVMAIDVKKARWGYIDVFLTNENIYALYSGNSFRNGTGGKFIHVYDFNGKLAKTYLLDREVSGISLDQTGKRFLGIDKSGTQIVVFKMR